MLKKINLLLVFFILFFNINLFAFDSGDFDILFTGVVVPEHDITIGLSVPGNIEQIFCKEGDYVKKNQKILSLRQKKEALQVEYLKMVLEDKSELESAKVEEEKLLSLLNSAKRLYEKTHSVSMEETIQLELKYSKAFYRRQQLEELEKQEAIKYEIAKENLDQLNLYSPIDGIITKIFFHEGERCKPNDGLVRIVNPDVCFFVSNIDKSFSWKIKKNMKVKLIFDEKNRKIEKTATINFISPVVDPASGLIEIKAKFYNKKNPVKPGISGKMILN